MSKFSIEIVQDIIQAQKWWEIFTPHRFIFDEWEFRYCFYKYFNYELFFYVGFINDEPIGLLPLQFNTDKGYLEFFGGSFMENNRVFIKPELEKYIPKFYEKINQKAKLRFICAEDKFTQTFEKEDFKYTVSLENLKDGNDYIQNYFHGETKKKLIKRIKNVSTSYFIEQTVGESLDLELLFEYNIQKFGSDSSFSFPHRKQIFRDLLHLSFKPLVTTFMVNGKKEAVSFSLLFRDVYESFNTGIHKFAPKELNSYIRIKKFDQAIFYKAKIFDAFVGDCGWKEKWGFTKIPQYKFEKNVV